jgi:hypothetical protein
MLHHVFCQQRRIRHPARPIPHQPTVLRRNEAQFSTPLLNYLEGEPLVREERRAQLSIIGSGGSCQDIEVIHRIIEPERAGLLGEEGPTHSVGTTDASPVGEHDIRVIDATIPA